MALTILEVKNAKPKEKTYLLKDERGLFLEITPKGGIWWRLRYSFNGKENRLSLGTFPDVNLQSAREKRDEARNLLAGGINPSDTRKQEKIETSEEYTFQFVAKEWAGKFKNTWTEGHAELTLRRLEMNVFPYLGARNIRDISAPELLACLRRIEARGALEVARRVRGICSMIFRYAIATGKADRDVSADLLGALTAPKKQHRPTITDPKRVGQLMLDIDSCKASMVVYCALRLAPLTFVRPGELRNAEWSEFNFKDAEWRIPAARMKMKEQHIVPLSTQSLAVLAELRPLTGNGKYLFPSLRTDARPMSDNTINVALRRIGYASDEICGHGFRGVRESSALSVSRSLALCKSAAAMAPQVLSLAMRSTIKTDTALQPHFWR